MLSAGWFRGSRANADGWAICTPTTWYERTCDPGGTTL